MNLWHSISKKHVKPDEFYVCIEISADSSMKYELDKETGALRLDRILSTATHYPHNYGFIPRTLGDDGDPLDVLLICSRPIVPLSIARAIPLGMIVMEDSGRNDEKILAVCPDDPMYGGYTSLDDLPPHVSQEIAHFFAVYKGLEPHKWTEVGPTLGKEDAIRTVKEAMDRYNEHYPASKK